MSEFNIIIGDVPHRDQDVLFGPWGAGDALMRFPPETRWPELLKALGIFPSTSQARKNGWNKDIACGWTHRRVGKLKHHIYIAKTTPEFEECLTRAAS